MEQPQSQAFEWGNKGLLTGQGMSGVQFVSGPPTSGNDSRPSAADLASFAAKAKEIQVGNDDIVDLGDDLGMNLLANQNKVGASPRDNSSGGARLNLGPSASSQSHGDIPTIQIKPMDDLEVVNLDAGPGASDIRIHHAGEPAPFVINTDNAFSATGNASAASSATSDATAPLSLEEELRQKKALLTKLQRLDGNGIGGQKMNLANSLDDIKAEYEKRTDSRNLEASIRFQRNALMTFVTGVEMVNEKFGSRLPVKPRLKGWSESVHTNIEDFDEIFEELYDMYKDSAKMHPMVRLVGTLGVSATMYHLTNTAAERSGIPGMADVLNENPELQRQFAAAMMAKMGGGLGNFMSAASGMQQQQQQQPSMQGMSANTSPSHPGLGIPVFNASSAAETPAQARREMRGPSGVDDILRAFEAERATTINPMMSSAAAPVFTPAGPPPSPPTVPNVTRAGLGTQFDPLAEFMMEETNSIGTTSTMNTERRRGRRKPAPVGATLNLNV